MSAEAVTSETANSETATSETVASEAVIPESAAYEAASRGDTDITTANITTANTTTENITIGHIAPEPTDQEREAILLALEQIAADLIPPAPQPVLSDSKWRFSGRWWSQNSPSFQKAL